MLQASRYNVTSSPSARVTVLQASRYKNVNLGIFSLDLPIPSSEFCRSDTVALCRSCKPFQH